MSAALHPLTRRALEALEACSSLEQGLPLAELRALANETVDHAGAASAGPELIALARRMVQGGLQVCAEQLVVLAGLALGDSAGSAVHRQPSSGAAEAVKQMSRPPPAGALRCGPLVQATARASLAQAPKCPVTRLMNTIRRRAPV